MFRTIIDCAILGCVAYITYRMENLMALGRETATALEELRVAIANEAAQSSTEDADVAAAIRAQIPNVSAIIGDTPAEDQASDENTAGTPDAGTPAE